MSASKYGPLVVPTIPPDEPVFVLRAQDRTSVTVLSIYRELCHLVGASVEHIDGVNDVIARFVNWQEINPVKVPD